MTDLPPTNATPAVVPPLPPWYKRVTRDTVLFVGGGALLFNEAKLEPEPRYLLLIVAATALGLPGVLRLDERRKEEAK